MEPGMFNSGLKRYGTGIGGGVGMAIMFKPEPGDDPIVIIFKLLVIAALPIASIIGDSMEKYAKAKYGKPNDAAQASAKVTTAIPPATPQG